MIPPTYLNGIKDIDVVLGLITDGSQRCPDVIDAIDASNMFQFLLAAQVVSGISCRICLFFTP
jgi:hypothetical protein